MSFSINTNVASLQAQNYLRTNSNFQNQTINRVTSGLRIVQSGDDAAGLAIANGYRSDEAVLTQGIRNANDGLSQLQIIDGGMNNISQLLDRARTLATQSASGTFTGDRGVLNSEFQNVLGEIDRQAQSIGLNNNGAFAKNMSVFIGGGKGTSDAAVIANGAVGIDLSKSTVDTKSLGMNSYQATNSTTYDLSASSTTSVAKLVGTGSANTTFYFRGAGFSDGPTATTGMAITVDTRGVTDTNTLVSAINTAIQNAANPTGTPTAEQTAFKNAGITASIVTDSTGRQQLAFSSSSTAFQARGGDDLANALLGNFDSTGLAGAHSSTVDKGSGFADFTTDLSGNHITVNGTAHALHDYSGTNVTGIANVVNEINTNVLNGNDVQAYADANGQLAFYSKTGKDFSLSFDTNLEGYTSGTTYDSGANGLISGGAQVSGQEASTTGTDHSKDAFSFGAITTGITQTVTLNAIKQDGSKVSLDLKLDSTNGTDVQTAINAINTQIKTNSTDPALQNIVAVNDNGGIRFMSTGNFSVTLGAAAGTGATRPMAFRKLTTVLPNSLDIL
jgi:flagellin